MKKNKVLVLWKSYIIFPQSDLKYINHCPQLPLRFVQFTLLFSFLVADDGKLYVFVYLA